MSPWRNSLLTPGRPPGRVARAVRSCAPVGRYWMETEVHVYAFSVAANILLSFFPFLIVVLSICRDVLHWRAATDAVFFALRDYFPEQLGGFIESNLKATIASRGPFQFFSVLLLLFTANGIFEPLEVALNRIWGCAGNRSFARNQLVSLGLIFACGSLVMMSTTMTALDNVYLRGAAGGYWGSLLSSTLFKLAAIPMSMLMLFLIYWLLPNCPVRPAEILPAAIVVGLLLELLKNINLLTWPWLRVKFRHEYGPFAYSVTIVIWGFLASMVVLGGAQWAARHRSPAAHP